MRLVEHLRELMSNPVSQSRIDKIQEDISFAVKSYYIGDFTKEELEYILMVLNEENDLDRLTLQFPGPLYGLLRKANLSPTEARSITDEERAHYLAAKENKLENPYFVIYISEEGGRKFINTFVSYGLDFSRPDEEIRQAIYDISTAPDNPSVNDLAKLP